MDSDWFKSRKRDLSVTDAALAEALGVERSVANKVVNGKVAFNARRAEAVATLFQVSRDEVLFRAGITPTATSSDSPALADGDTVEIGKLDLSLSMGPGTLIGDYVEETTYSFDSRLLRLITRTPANRLKLVTGIGDSNYPTLQHADDILIDTTDRMMSRQDAFYWIDLYGAAGLKRLRAIGKKRVLVQSDNPAVENQEVDAEDLRIHGRAIWVMRGL
jgi:phage repressor protein C with HTH and peptisase S24 domain